MTATPVRSEVRMPIASSGRVTAAVLLAAALLLCRQALADSAMPTHAVVYGSLALASYASALLFLVTAGQEADVGLARWKFGPWILLWYGLSSGVATLTWSGPQTSVAAEIVRLLAVALTFCARRTA